MEASYRYLDYISKGTHACLWSGTGKLSILGAESNHYL